MNKLKNKIKGDVVDRVNKELIKYSALSSEGYYNNLIYIRHSIKNKSLKDSIIDDEDKYNLFINVSFVPIENENIRNKSIRIIDKIDKQVKENKTIEQIIQDIKDNKIEEYIDRINKIINEFVADTND